LRIPKQAPKFLSCMEKLGNVGDFADLLRKVPSSVVQGKYRHWDKLRYLTPPEGLNHDQWWSGLKFRRKSELKILPFEDTEQQCFQYAIVDPIPEKLHDIDLMAGGSVQMESQITSPETRDHYYVSSLIGEAITSSQLEGAVTTTQVAKEMLHTGRLPRDRSEQMIFNNYLTMQKIGDLKKESLTKELVFEIHRIITQDTLDDSTAPGRFREEKDGPVLVEDWTSGEALHIPPKPDSLAQRMELLCRFANGEVPDYFIHPVIRAITVHFMLAYDHPFVDGNGRTARALFYWCMLHHDYWLFEFVTISPILRKAPEKYARAYLYTETDEGDLTYFLLFQLRVIDRAIAELHAYLERKTKQLKAVERQLQSHVAFNNRQMKLLSHALRHPKHRYTIAAHKHSHNVVYQTARTDLLGLEKSGLFTSFKVGRTLHFTPVENLQKALEELS
jgi:Fic family protein